MATRLNLKTPSLAEMRVREAISGARLAGEVCDAGEEAMNRCLNLGEGSEASISKIEMVMDKAFTEMMDMSNQGCLPEELRVNTELNIQILNQICQPNPAKYEPARHCLASMSQMAASAKPSSSLRLTQIRMITPSKPEKGKPASQYAYRDLRREINKINDDVRRDKERAGTECQSLPNKDDRFECHRSVAEQTVDVNHDLGEMEGHGQSPDQMRDRGREFGRELDCTLKRYGRSMSHLPLDGRCSTKAEAQPSTKPRSDNINPGPAAKPEKTNSFLEGVKEVVKNAILMGPPHA